jgi:hypothetical protein
MQKVGLSQEYKSSESEIGIWLKSIFGIAFLGPDESSGRVNSSCSTSGVHCDILVKYPVISHDKERRTRL